MKSLLERIEELELSQVCQLLDVDVLESATKLEREKLDYELHNRIEDEEIDEIELLIIESGN